MNKNKRLFEGLCPRLPCRLCAMKDGDPGIASDPYATKKGKCEFYADNPDGYADGWVTIKNPNTRRSEWHQLKKLKCPRALMFCTECPKSRNGKTCIKFEQKKSLFDSIYRNGG